MDHIRRDSPFRNKVRNKVRDKVYNKVCDKIYDKILRLRSLACGSSAGHSGFGYFVSDIVHSV